MATRLLLLMRHAEAVTFAPGLGDIDRPLSDAGRDQARRAGAHLAEQHLGIDLVLCSASARTRETAGLLGLSAPVQASREIYNAGSDTIRELIGEVSDTVTSLLVVGHAPGIPTLAQVLTDQAVSPAERVAAISRGFPPATLVALRLEGSWADLRPGLLESVFCA